MKNFLRHSAYFAFLAAITLFSSCAEDDVFSQLFGRAMPMRLSGGIVPFDADSTSATRAGEWQWPDGAQLYLQLYNGNTRIPATATFNKDTETWTIGNVNGLAKSGKSEAYYFEKGLSSISYSNGVYGDSNGTYTMNDDYIVISNNLEPLTSRVRFLNVQPSISIKIDGISSYKSYDPSTNNFTTSDESITLNNASGDSPYCYGWFTDEQTRKMTVTTYIPNSDDPDSKTFVRSFGENVLKKGVSGTLSIPTKENYESLSWTWENKPIEIEAVDLGLPSGTKWANMNLGAVSPEDYGLYYAWGETEGFNSSSSRSFFWESYKWINEGQSDWQQINKYQQRDDQYSACWFDTDGNFIGDGLTLLMPEDDAATNNWGMNWRTPNNDDFNELRENTTHTWTWRRGSYGVLFESNINRNSIFIPANGYRRRNFGTNNRGSECYLWSAAAGSKTTKAYCYDVWGTVEGNFMDHLWDDHDRCEGLAIRPVTDQEKGQTSDDILTFNVNGVSFNMIRVEHGSFQMGSEDTEAAGDEKPVHKVTLTKDYYIGETEVTQALWYAVMGQKPTSITSSGSQWSEEYGLGNNYPAYFVSWTDITGIDGPFTIQQNFLFQLNKILNDQGVLAEGAKFRLPTEAEWEFAARGGTKSKNYKYSGGTVLSDVAWYDDNSNGKTHDVGHQDSNELGLYDMSGNVWEWCSDYHSEYSGTEQTDPTGPTGDYIIDDDRIIRGGSYCTSRWDSYGCRITCRNFFNAVHRDKDIGFRLVLQ